MIHNITKIIVRRRCELNSLLRRNDLKKETRHQIKGALNEVDYILNTLDKYNKNPNTPEDRKNINE